MLESKREANVAIVGGGVVGLSCALELARAGVRGIVVFDKSGPASGTTGGSAGVICPVELGEMYIVMSLLGFEGIRQLVKEAALPFTTAGSLHVIYDADPDKSYEEALALCRAYGGDASSLLWPEQLKVQEIRSRMPWIRESVRVPQERRVTGGVLYPNQGFVNPYEVVRTYELLLHGFGIEVRWCTPVVGIRTKAESVTELVTRRGVWSCGRVLNAAGPWGAKVAALAGVDIPLTPQRVQVCVAESKGTPVAPLTGGPEPVLGEGVWCRGEEGGMLLFGQHHHTTRAGFTVDPDSANRGNDEDYPSNVKAVYRRYWSLDHTEFFAGWSCVYGTTVDGYPIVCGDKHLNNLYHAVGMNGHGITIHPAVAQVARTLIVGEGGSGSQEGGEAAAPQLDAAALGLERSGLVG